MRESTAPQAFIYYLRCAQICCAAMDTRLCGYDGSDEPFEKK
jgi:hypothetical protein